MSQSRIPNIDHGNGEVNLRFSAEDLSGLGPDAQSLLRQLVASQRERQYPASSSDSGLLERRLSQHGPQVTHRPLAYESVAGLPGSIHTHNRIPPSTWQHHLSVQPPADMGLDDFDRQILAGHGPPQLRAPYVASDYRMTPVPSAMPFSEGGRLLSAPSSSFLSTAFSTAPSLSSSRLTLPSSLTNRDVRAAPTRTIYSPAMEPQPATWQFQEIVNRNTPPLVGQSALLPTSRQTSRENQRSKSREPFLTKQQFAPRNHSNPGSAAGSIITTSSSSPCDMGPSSSPAAKAGLRRQLPQSLQAPSKAPTASLLSAKNSHSLELAHAPPIANGINLINPRDVLPDRFREIFPYDLFNAVQSRCLEYAYQTSDNLVVSAPTGSGKTAILELAICRLAHMKGNEDFKIVYLCPLKALCTERANDWRQKFGMMAMEVAELTGDTSQAEMRRVRQAAIIVTTPEKWDSITRSWSDHRKLLDLVELFLIDEVHLLKEPRGSTLEAVVSRMKTRGANVRFVALSATVPNSDDVARWLGRDHTNPEIPAHRATFGEEFRPVKLQRFVYGFDSRTNDYQFDTFLTDHLYPHITKHSQRKPILVFCQTRKSCQTSAKKLAEEWNERQPQSRPWPEPTKRVPVISPELQEIVRFGVAFHHAGLDSQDRRAVEQAFLDGRLSVICCTSTLAMGLNLPCHMVVLKGTTAYQDGSLAELSDLEFIQMLGRAGRPQFGNSGIAVVLTRARNKQHYEDMGSGQQILESTLHQNLIEHLNSEINLGTFQDTQKAKEWLKGTFLAVRLDRHPEYYKLEETGSLDAPLEDRLERICEADIKKLQQTGLVTEEFSFRSTDYGRAMSRYMIRFNSMQRILQIPHAAKMEQVLTAVCEADEFGDFRWRTQEREVFRELNKSPFVAYPIKETVNTMAHKASLLLQAALGCVDLSNVSETFRRQIMLDTNLLFEKMQRLVRAVVECKASDLDGVTCRVALDLARSMAARAWEGKSMQLTQVPQLGPVFMRKFVASGITTVHDLAGAGASNIERILSRNPPFGKKMADELAHFPRLTLEARLATETPRAVDPDRQPVARIDAILGFSNPGGKPKWRGKIPSVTFVAETTEGVLAHWWRGSLKKFKEEDGNKLSLKFEVVLNSVTEEVICYFSCEEIVGTIVTRRLKHGLPASAFPRKELTSVFSEMSEKSAASLIDDDIGDSDLLEITKHGSGSGPIFVNSQDSDTDSRWLMPNRSDKYHADDRDTKSVGDTPAIQDSGTEETPWQPIQLPNGKFKCNHHCADFGIKNRNGKPCAHRCCREGLDAPRKPKPSNSKRKAGQEIVVAGSQQASQSSTKKAKTSRSNSQLSSNEPSREPLASAAANRRVPPVKSLDDFDLDGDGLFDLTQFESTHVNAVTSLHRSPQKVQKAARKKRMHDEEASLFEDLSDDALQDGWVSQIISKGVTKDENSGAGKRTSLLQAELAKTQSNNTDNFSGDSLFDGVNEVPGGASCSPSDFAELRSVSKKQPGDNTGVQSRKDPESQVNWEESFSDTLPWTARYLDQQGGNYGLDAESRASLTCPPFDHSGMAGRVEEASFTSPTIRSTTRDAPLPQATSKGIEAKGFEDETYIFSDNFVLPPPRDGFDEGNLALLHGSISGQVSGEADASAVRNPAELGDRSSRTNGQPQKPQQDSGWEGFEPGFTDEFRDLVELI